MDNTKVYKMSFSKIYRLLFEKANKKGRTKAEVDEVIYWLTGHDEITLRKQIEQEVSIEEFFLNAPQLNPDRKLIKGVVCGHRVEDIIDPMMQNIRYLDKLIDELAKGKSMDKIIRKP